MISGLFLDQPGPIESVFLVAGAASVCIWWWFAFSIAVHAVKRRVGRSKR